MSIHPPQLRSPWLRSPERSKASVRLLAILCVLATLTALPLIGAPKAEADPTIGCQPSRAYVDDPAPRVSARLFIPSGYNVVATDGTNAQEGSYSGYVARADLDGGGSTYPSNTIDHCFTFSATHRDSGFEIEVYGNDPTHDKIAEIELYPGVWDVSLEVTSTVAETFDGLLHRFSDTDSKVVEVSQMPCGDFIDGPIADDPDHAIFGQLDILPGLDNPADDLIVDPETGQGIFTAEVVLDASGTIIRGDYDVCVQYRAVRRDTNGTDRIVRDHNDGSLDPETMNLAPGIWDVDLEIWSTDIRANGERHLVAHSERSAIVTSRTPVDIEPIPEPVLGDANCDGVRNATDAMTIMQYVVGMRSSTQACNGLLPADAIYLPHADVDFSGDVSAVDALFILQCEVDIENALCP